MNDFAISLVRTYVTIGVGLGLAWLARTLGIVIDESTSAHVTALAVAVAIAVYYTLVRVLETRWPWAGRLLGRAAAPRYQPPAGARMATGRPLR